MHHMILNTESYFGNGCVQKIGDEARERNFSCALIVTDKQLIKFGTLRPVFASLQSRGISYSVFDEVEPNPTIRVVQAGTKAFFDSEAQFIIAVGGGSAIDTAKGISIVAANPKHSDVRSLEHVSQTDHRGITLFAVPTTAGTASEVTIDYVITDEENERKFLCADDNCIPRVAFIDAEMMAGMPQKLAAATGMDALTHAIEAYCSKRAWDMTEILALKAIECIAQNLKHSCQLHEAREKMALGQYLAGMAFSNGGLGANHALAHPLSAVHHIPHGLANAILLPKIIEFNAPFVGEKVRHIAKAMGIHGTANMNQEQYVRACIDAVETLKRSIGITQNLGELGVTEETIPLLAKQAMADACMADNPRPMHTGNVEAIYRSLL
ncbi:MAG: iron-containing alcohol dehydrogenase family protein [Clostridia bacterium]|nr:iron-containing alcohol dehydrogenase family protein [Clostridia bacterium]